MPERTLSPLFTWRSAICDSGLPAPTRHVALVLSLHMSERGDSCFPRLDTLAAESGLTMRTVADHLKALEAAGLLHREFKKKGEGRGTRVEYTATFPTTPQETTCGQTTCPPNTRVPTHDHPRSDDTTTCGETTGQEDVMRASEDATPPPAPPTRGKVDELTHHLLAACALEPNLITRKERAKARLAAEQLAELTPVPDRDAVFAAGKEWRRRWPSQPNPTGIAANWGDLMSVRTDRSGHPPVWKSDGLVFGPKRSA